jgi:predicted nucleic acid-binding protein
MSAVVVDTNVVSYLFKRDNRAGLYRRHLAGNRWVISFMTVAELDWWALTRRWGQARREQMARHLQRFEVYFTDRDLCRWWAEATERARRRGRPILPADAWIAATALALAAPLVTHDPGDYAGVDGLTVLSEARP